jgi:hypothetical protein
MKELLRQIIEELENVHVVAASDRLFELVDKAKKELDKAPSIVIEVRGGVVVDVLSESPVEYEVRDWDDIECGEVIVPEE